MSGRRRRAARRPRSGACRASPKTGRHPVYRRPRRRARRASRKAAWIDRAVEAPPLSPAILVRIRCGAGAAATKETPMTEALTVRREIQIAAPPATVFAFLTDPEKIVSWMGAEVTTEAHPGGLYLVKGVGDRAHVARGEFREVVPVHRLPHS